MPKQLTALFLAATLFVGPWAFGDVNARNGIAITTASTINGITPNSAINGQTIVGGGPAYVDEVLADSPVGYWRLGETSGTSASDLGSAAQAGTYSGGYTQNQTSLLASDTANKAVLLNGSSGYIDCTNNTAFNFNGGNMTAECLVKFTNFPADGSSAWLIGKAYDSGTDDVAYSLRLEVSGGGSTKTLKIESYNAPTAYGTTFDASAWTTGTIYHIAAVYDGTNWKLYVNGSNVATTAGSGPQTSGRALMIGREDNSFGTGGYFDGVIDEVAVYNTGLSAVRIAAHYAAVN